MLFRSYVSQASKPGLAYSEGFATAWGQRNTSSIDAGEWDAVYLAKQRGTTWWFDIAAATINDWTSPPAIDAGGPLDQPLSELHVARMVWHLWAPPSAGTGFYAGAGDDAILTASVIGAFYYLRVIKLMYFDEAADPSPISAPVGMRLTLSINGAAILLLGILPGPLMTACVYSISQALAS